LIKIQNFYRLACLDGISIKKIATSKFIRSSFERMSMKLPKARKTIMKLILKRHAKLCQELKDKFADNVANSQRFSIIFDEYTSLRNRRYLNLTLRSEDGIHYDLGMIRMRGSYPAEKCLELISSRLKEFNLDLTKDIVCSTTDGASVMVKFGRISPGLHQQCYSHAIHLAVLGVIYKKNDKRRNDDDNNIESDDESDSEIERESLDQSDYENSESDDELDEGTFEFEIEGEDEIVGLNDSFQEVISKTRSIVKYFKSSPLRNDTLQKYIIEDKKRRLTLILDVRTRWNSLFYMLRRYLEVNKCVSKALLDHPGQDDLNKDEILALTSIVNCLEPVTIGLESLCRKEADLLQADIVLKFIFDQLQAQESTIAQHMLDELRTRIQQRRNCDVVSLMRYLEDPNCLHEDYEIALFKMSTKPNLIKLAKSLLLQHFPQIRKSGGNSVDEVSCSNEEEQKNKEDNDSLARSDSLKDKLQSILYEAKNKKLQVTENHDHSALNKEFSIYETTLKKTSNLELLYKMLKTIPPTSVESGNTGSTGFRCSTNTKNRF
jgi:hypothetical protein